MAEIKAVSFDTWQDFKRGYVTHLFGDKPFFEPGRYIFRGHGNADWRLVASYDRQFDFISDRARRRDEGVRLLDSYLELLGQHGLAEDLPPDNKQVQLIFAQHYGLPTRLLDWSANLYVAAFFAFEDHFVSPGDGLVAVWALDVKSPLWSSPHGAEILKPKPSDNPTNIRLRNQSGVFTLTYSRDFDGLEDCVHGSDYTGTPLIKFTLPASEARSAMAELDFMGINPGHLFSDAQGVARLTVMRAVVEYMNSPSVNA